MPYIGKRLGKKPVYRRRAIYKRRGMKRAKQSLHAPKKFVLSFKYMDIKSNPNGTNPSGWKSTILSCAIDQAAGYAELLKIYKQFALTGIAFQYRPVNTDPSTTSPATQMLFVEDKDTIGTLNPTQALSQNNVRKLVTNKPFKHYVKKPRAELYQQDFAGNAILATQGARYITWIDRANDGQNHLAAQLLVQDQPSTGSSTDVLQGELWCKLYIVCKEQCI